MKLTVIVPVGPGHEKYSKEAIASVEDAVASYNPFDDVVIDVVDDTSGSLGRSKARNIGILRAKTEWVFLLDADDLMLKHTFWMTEDELTSDVCAVFGSVYTQQRVSPSVTGSYVQDDVCVINGRAPEDRSECTWDTILRGDARGTVSMGAFFRRECLLDNLFLEDIDAGEDFEFYLNLFSKYAFTKIGFPLVLARTRAKSATGPRGYDKLDWVGACQPFIEFWKARGRVPLTQADRAVKQYWKINASLSVKRVIG